MLMAETAVELYRLRRPQDRLLWRSRAVSACICSYPGKKTIVAEGAKSEKGPTCLASPILPLTFAQYDSPLLCMHHSFIATLPSLLNLHGRSPGSPEESKDSTDRCPYANLNLVHFQGTGSCQKFAAETSAASIITWKLLREALSPSDELEYRKQRPETQFRNEGQESGWRRLDEDTMIAKAIPVWTVKTQERQRAVEGSDAALMSMTCIAASPQRKHETHSASGSDDRLLWERL